MSMLWGLLHANFISEVKYIEWLSNIVLSKKVSGKLSICVDYTNLNWVFPMICILFPT